MSVRWNSQAYECKTRRHQRLVGKCYFQTASPFLAVATQGRMDALKHLWHSALTISVTKSANVSSTVETLQFLDGVHTDSISEWGYSSFVDNIFCLGSTSTILWGPVHMFWIVSDVFSMCGILSFITEGAGIVWMFLLCESIVITSWKAVCLSWLCFDWHRIDCSTYN